MQDQKLKLVEQIQQLNESFVRYLSFILEIWYQQCTVILEVKNNIRTSFKLLGGKKEPKSDAERL